MTLLGVLLVGLQLLLSGASTWHHHDTAGDHERCDHRDDQDQAPQDPGEDCSVCLAINLMGQATFDAPAVVEAPGWVEILSDRAPSVVWRDEVVAIARGPPAVA